MKVPSCSQSAMNWQGEETVACKTRWHLLFLEFVRLSRCTACLRRLKGGSYRRLGQPRRFCLIWAKRRSRSSTFERSPSTPVTFLLISFIAVLSSDSRRPVMNTCAPSSTNRLAVANPIPLVLRLQVQSLLRVSPYFISPCKPVALAPCSPCSERYRLLRRSMRSTIRVALTYSSDQRTPRTRHDLCERTCLLRAVVLVAQAALQEPSCTACIRRIQALRI